MFIKMLVPMEGHRRSLLIGDVIKVDQTAGKRLVEAGFAEEVEGQTAAPIESAARALPIVEDAAARVFQGGGNLSDQLTAAATSKAKVAKARS